MTRDRDSHPTQSRKADHLRACLEDDVTFRRQTTGLEHYHFRHCALPDRALDRLELGTTFLDKPLRAPLLISSMTGGTDLARQLNERLAAAAQHYGLAMGVGSQRVAIEQPTVADSFTLRRVAPDALLLANLGAVQLNYGYSLDQAQRAVDQLEADGLILHLNPLQEAVQTRGDRDFSGLLPKIEALCDRLPVPVIAKEVGNGISAAIAQRLWDVGVTAIDVAGAGGTSWAKVESVRATDPMQRRLGQTFGEWGIPTAAALVDIRSALPKVPLIASGGIRNGLEAAKAIALGADLVGLALPFLQAAHDSEDALAFEIEALMAELRTVLFCTDCADWAALRSPGVLFRD